MAEPRDYHTMSSKSERERQIAYDITYTWNLKYDQMDTSAKQKQTHRHREQTWGCQWGGGAGGLDWEFVIRRCKILFLGWLHN